MPLDVGLQLSVSATLGIILLGPVVRRWLRLRKLPKLVAEPLGLTLAVTLACLPVTLSAFQVVSLISPVAHILAVPLLAPCCCAPRVLALVAAAPLPPLAAAAAWLAWLPTTLLAATIHVFGSLPGAAISTGRARRSLACYWRARLLGCGVWHLPELRRRRTVWSRWRADQRRALVARQPGRRLPWRSGVAVPGAAGWPVSIMPLPLSSGQAVFIRGPPAVPRSCPGPSLMAARWPLRSPNIWRCGSTNSTR